MDQDPPDFTNHGKQEEDLSESLFDRIDAILCAALGGEDVAAALAEIPKAHRQGIEDVLSAYRDLGLEADEKKLLATSTWYKE
jgi:hypothetical protein